MLATNKNLLALTGFKLTFDNPEMANIPYFTTSATLPGVSGGPVQTSYRNKAGFMFGEKLTYDPVTLRIALDENLKVYDELYKWMLTNTETTQLKKHNFVLSLLTSHNNVSKEIRFIRAFPISIGSLEFNVQTPDVEYAYLDVSFQYDRFEFV